MNFQKVIDEFRESVGTNISEAMAFINLNLCPIPLISQMAVQVAELFRIFGEVGNSNSVKEYYETPAFTMQALKYYGGLVREYQIVTEMP